MGGKCCKCEDNVRTTNKYEEHRMTSLGSGTDSEPQPAPQPARELAPQPAPRPAPQPAPPPEQPPPPPPPPPRHQPQVRDLLTNVCD